MAELTWNEEEIQHIDSLKELGLQKLTLDINRRIEPKFAKENDTKSRGLDIQVKKDNKVIDTTGIVLKMYAMPVKEQEVYEIESTVIDASRGKYEIVYPTVILQAGITLAEIVLTKDEQVISSKKFKIEVESRLLTDDVVKGHDAYPLFEQLLEAAKTIEGVDIAAEEEREKNEIIRQTQEQQRQESMTDIEHRFNLLETSKQQDAEVINARTSTVKGKTFNSLNDRLEETEKEIDKPLYSTPVETYDNVISLPDNTTNGVIDCKLKGNTETDEEGNAKSTPAAMKIKSVGKNLFDGNLVQGNEHGSNFKTNAIAEKYIPILSQTNYFAKCSFSLPGMYFHWYDSGKNIIKTDKKYNTDFIVVTSPNNAKYAKVMLYDNEGVDIPTIKMIVGQADTPTEYEPYKESTAYVVAKDKDNKIVNLMSHEGVHDEIDLDKRELIKRIGVDKEGLTYQLAEPEHIPIEIEGELQAYENGTVYFTPYIKDKFIVDNTKLIKLQYPIKTIDKLLKLDTANAKWIEVEGVLSEDGQTITVIEEGTYKVYGEIQEGYSTNGLKRIVTNINLNAQINSNTTAIEKINNKIYADADLFTAMLLQQEVRITALEQGGVI